MPDTRLLISCVGENNPLYTSEAHLLFKTIRKFGGKLADKNNELMANFVGSIDPIVERNLNDLRVSVRIVEPFDDRNPNSNKIRMLELDDYDYDVLVALDCDTVVLQDFSGEIYPEFFQALPVDTDLLTVQQWRALFSFFNWELQGEKFNTTKKSVIPYFNSGVLLLPKPYVKQIRKSWGECILRLFERLDELTYQRYFFEELALALAIEKEKIPSKMLPLELNFSIQSINGYLRATSQSGQALKTKNISPFIYHYHHRFNLDGLLAKSGYKKLDLAIGKVNKLLLLDSSGAKKNVTTKSSSISKEKMLNQTNAMVSRKVNLAKQKDIEEKERMMMSMDDQLKKAIQDVETLQNINLEHQKTLEQKDLELKKAIQDVETLQNINLRHEKTLEQKGLELKKAIQDVETLQNINLRHEKTLEQKGLELKKALQDLEILKEKDNKIKSMQTEIQSLKEALDSIRR